MHRMHYIATPLIHHFSHTQEPSQFYNSKSSNGDTIIGMYLKYNTTRERNYVIDLPLHMAPSPIPHIFQY
jgi:hypothetical protein